MRTLSPADIGYDYTVGVLFKFSQHPTLPFETQTGPIIKPTSLTHLRYALAPAFIPSRFHTAMDTDIEKQVGESSGSTSIHQDVPKLANCKFGWRDVSFSVDTKQGKKKILENVTGCVEKGIRHDVSADIGTLLAIMGPSGCGKTTLLNILSRRLTGSGVTGEQLLQGSSFDDQTLRAMSTYVEQEDHLIGSLTVQETIEFAAKLALPGSVGRRERKERTEQMLKDFGLVSVKGSKIGTPLQRGISGGQKRRVTTASQLITLPKIIFLGMV